MTAKTNDPRFPRAALAVAWVIALAVVITWIVRTPHDPLVAQLIRLQFWSLEACVVIILGAALLAAREARQYLTRSDAVRIAVVMGLALLIVLVVAPRTNRIYYDEQNY